MKISHNLFPTGRRTMRLLLEPTPEGFAHFVRRLSHQLNISGPWSIGDNYVRMHVLPITSGFTPRLLTTCTC